MQYGFILPHGDVHTLAELAHEAEIAGWDGVFYWDGIYIKETGPMYDPWIVLAADGFAYRARAPRIDPHASFAATTVETGPRDSDAGPPLPRASNPASWVRRAR